MQRQPLIYLFIIATLFLNFKNYSQPFIASTSAIKPPIQKGVVYQKIDDITQYFVSEKLDGVRGYWNGKQLFTRQGHLINTPNWFTEHWPNIALDGELWIARGKFEQVSGIIRQQTANDDDWLKVKFMLFDIPQSKDTFEQRVAQLKDIVRTSKSSHLMMIKQQKFTNNTQVMNFLDEVIAKNGEGLMLHHQNAHYKVGRNTQLMKLKRYQDAEAVVIAHLPGKGKFSGLLGALTVKNDDGVIFNIGSGFTKNQRQSPPPIGTIITYKYFGKTAKGTPRFASFMRIRTDANL